MKLQDLAKQILKEDTWGNNPSAGGSSNPGRSPTAKSPNPSQHNPQTVNLKTDLDRAVGEIEAFMSKKEREVGNAVGKQLNGKNVTVKASKGSIGQTERDYTIDVTSTEVHDLNDIFYIVLKGTEQGSDKESEYYVNTNFQAKINAAASPENEELPNEVPQPPIQSKLKQVGGVVSTKPLNTHTARNIVPQG